MNFDELKTTSFTEEDEGYFKFIVVILEDTQGKKKTIVRAEPGRIYSHEDIRDRLRESTPLRVTCLGGGHLNITGWAKHMRIEGSSSNIGHEPDRGETIRLLQEATPSFRIEKS